MTRSDAERRGCDPRTPIDRVVVRLEATPGRTVHAVVKKGTPRRPRSRRPDPDGGDLGVVACTGARGGRGHKYRRGKITDERGNASLCG